MSNYSFPIKSFSHMTLPDGNFYKASENHETNYTSSRSLHIFRSQTNIDRKFKISLKNHSYNVQ